MDMGAVERRFARRQPIRSGFCYEARVRRKRRSERLLIAVRMALPPMIDAIGMQSPPVSSMRGSNIYLTRNGWMYEVWFQERVIVIGCCATLEAAVRAATNV